MSNHKDLDVWKSAMELAKDVYRVTAAFPPSEAYGLTSQMRRSAVSVASNIAEGAARNTDKEFIHFLHVALGSIAELETQYLLSKELAFTNRSPAIETNLERVRKLIVGLIKYLRNK